jgi:phage replication-related protein YjqB (UPF0714/DUF867 family)
MKVLKAKPAKSSAKSSTKSSKEPEFKAVLKDPAVREVFLPGNGVGIFAPHGGGIEPGTEEIARAVAQATGATLYVLSAKRPTGNTALHVTVTRMTTGISPKLDQAIAATRVAISIHGHGRTKDGGPVYVSGLAAEAVTMCAGAMRHALKGAYEVVDEHARIPDDLVGHHKDNIINRVPKKGVQIELPRALRDEAVPAIRGAAAQLVTALIEVVRELG